MDGDPESAGRFAGLQQDMAGIPGGLWQSTGRALAGERSAQRPHLHWSTPATHRAGGLAPAEAPSYLQQLQSGLRGTKVQHRHTISVKAIQDLNAPENIVKLEY